jgi:hypothetical protein
VIRLTLYFASTRKGTLGGFDIFAATRAATTDNFAAPIAVANVNTAETDVAAHIVGTVLYWWCFSATGGTDIYFATLGSAGFSTPTVVELGAAGKNRSAAVSHRARVAPCDQRIGSGLPAGAGGLRDIDLEARRDLGKRAVDLRDVLIELGAAGRWFDASAR